MRELAIYLNRIVIRLVPLALVIVFLFGATGHVPVKADPGYFGSGTSANITGLNSGQIYYFQA